MNGQRSASFVRPNAAVDMEKNDTVRLTSVERKNLSYQLSQHSSGSLLKRALYSEASLWYICWYGLLSVQLTAILLHVNVVFYHSNTFENLGCRLLNWTLLSSSTNCSGDLLSGGYAFGSLYFACIIFDFIWVFAKSFGHPLYARPNADQTLLKRYMENTSFLYFSFYLLPVPLACFTYSWLRDASPIVFFSILTAFALGTIFIVYMSVNRFQFTESEVFFSLPCAVTPIEVTQPSLPQQQSSSTNVLSGTRTSESYMATNSNGTNGVNGGSNELPAFSSSTGNNRTASQNAIGGTTTHTAAVGRASFDSSAVVRRTRPQPLEENELPEEVRKEIGLVKSLRWSFISKQGFMSFVKGLWSTMPYGSTHWLPFLPTQNHCETEEKEWERFTKEHQHNAVEKKFGNSENDEWVSRESLSTLRDDLRMGADVSIGVPASHWECRRGRWVDLLSDRFAPQRHESQLTVRTLCVPQAFRLSPQTPISSDLCSTRLLAVYRRVRLRDFFTLQFPFANISLPPTLEEDPISGEPTFSGFGTIPINSGSFTGSLASAADASSDVVAVTKIGSANVALNMATLETVHACLTDAVTLVGNASANLFIVGGSERKPHLGLSITTTLDKLTGPIAGGANATLLVENVRLPVVRMVQGLVITLSFAGAGFVPFSYRSFFFDGTGDLKSSTSNALASGVAMTSLLWGAVLCATFLDAFDHPVESLLARWVFGAPAVTALFLAIHATIQVHDATPTLQASWASAIATVWALFNALTMLGLLMYALYLRWPMLRSRLSKCVESYFLWIEESSRFAHFFEAALVATHFGPKTSFVAFNVRNQVDYVVESQNSTNATTTANNTNNENNLTTTTTNNADGAAPPQLQQQGRPSAVSVGDETIELVVRGSPTHNANNNNATSGSTPPTGHQHNGNGQLEDDMTLVSQLQAFDKTKVEVPKDSTYLFFRHDALWNNDENDVKNNNNNINTQSGADRTSFNINDNMNTNNNVFTESLSSDTFLTRLVGNTPGAMHHLQLLNVSASALSLEHRFFVRSDAFLMPSSFPRSSVLATNVPLDYRTLLVRAKADGCVYARCTSNTSKRVWTYERGGSQMSLFNIPFRNRNYRTHVNNNNNNNSDVSSFIGLDTEFLVIDKVHESSWAGSRSCSKVLHPMAKQMGKIVGDASVQFLNIAKVHRWLTEHPIRLNLSTAQLKLLLATTPAAHVDKILKALFEGLWSTMLLENAQNFNVRLKLATLYQNYIHTQNDAASWQVLLRLHATRQPIASHNDFCHLRTAAGASGMVHAPVPAGVPRFWSVCRLSDWLRVASGVAEDLSEPGIVIEVHMPAHDDETNDNLNQIDNELPLFNPPVQHFNATNNNSNRKNKNKTVVRSMCISPSNVSLVAVLLAEFFHRLGVGEDPIATASRLRTVELLQSLLACKYGTNNIPTNHHSPRPDKIRSSQEEENINDEQPLNIAVQQEHQLNGSEGLSAVVDQVISDSQAHVAHDIAQKCSLNSSLCAELQKEQSQSLIRHNDEKQQPLLLHEEQKTSNGTQETRQSTHTCRNLDDPLLTTQLLSPLPVDVNMEVKTKNDGPLFVSFLFQRSVWPAEYNQHNHNKDAHVVSFIGELVPTNEAPVAAKRSLSDLEPHRCAEIFDARITTVLTTKDLKYNSMNDGNNSLIFSSTSFNKLVECEKDSILEIFADDEEWLLHKVHTEEFLVQEEMFALQ